MRIWNNQRKTLWNTIQAYLMTRTSPTAVNLSAQQPQFQRRNCCSWHTPADSRDGILKELLLLYEPWFSPPRLSFLSVLVPPILPKTPVIPSRFPTHFCKIQRCWWGFGRTKGRSFGIRSVAQDGYRYEFQLRFSSAFFHLLLLLLMLFFYLGIKPFAFGCWSRNKNYSGKYWCDDCTGSNIAM